MGGATVLCAGMFRSGSTWAYNVVRAILRAVDPTTPVEAGYFEGDDLVAELARPVDGHRVIKFHLGTPAVLDAIERGAADAVVHSRRDPMTALASCVDQFCNRPGFAEYWTFDKAIEHIEDGLRLGRDLADRAEVVTIDLHAAGEAASLDLIVGHLAARDLLGAGLDDATRRAIRDGFAFDAMRERSIVIAGTAPERLFRGINDPETLMHARHVDKGVARDWTAELTAEQVTAALERLAA